MEIYPTQLKSGIKPTPEFAKKKLAEFAVNIGIRCSHCCTYCSVPASTRMHQAHKDAGVSAFEYKSVAIVDPHIDDAVRHDAKAMRRRGMVQLCTIVDAWAPEGVMYDLGRKCLEAILAEPGWTVRILTKNVAVMKDFDVVQRYRDRVLVGISITGTPNKSDVIQAIEPFASPIPERIAAMKEAHRLGLRTYAMFCPLLPGISDGPDQIDELIQTALEFGAEEVFIEAVNARGKALPNTVAALEGRGHAIEAEAADDVRTRAIWSGYVRRLIQNSQRSVRKYWDIDKLRFLLYPTGLKPEDLAAIRADDAGIIWLGNERTKAPRRVSPVLS